MPKFKLTTQDKEKGRELLKTAFLNHNLQDLYKFYDWVICNLYISEKVVKKCFDIMFTTNNTERALQLYDNIVSQYHPLSDIFRGLFLLVVRATILIGVIGGVIYFIRCCW